MDKTVPAAAAHILGYIYKHEVGGFNYETISSNKQKQLSKPITKMTIKELLADMQTWRKRLGTLSSAAGAPQIIHATLRDLVAELQLNLNQRFDSDLQDRLAYHLLRKRGYDAWQAGRIATVEFAKRLAQEWASLPVLEDTYKELAGGKRKLVRRGQGWYDGDGMNAAGGEAETFAAVLTYALNLQAHVDIPPTKPKVKDIAVVTTVAVGTGGAVVGGAKDAAEQVTTWEPVITLASKISTYGPMVAGAIVVGVVLVIIARKVWKG